MPIPVALTIAGSDPSGGAGIQADLKTFHQFEVYGTAVITLITVQNTMRVDRVECLDPQLVRQQIRAVLDDLPPAAAKTGALGSREIVEAVADEAAEFGFPLVVDPVMISKHGLPLVAEEAKSALVRQAHPAGVPADAECAGSRGADGHRNSRPRRYAARRLRPRRAWARARCSSRAATWPATPSICSGRPQGCREFPAPRIETRHTHGTGCTYSAAITAELARGAPLETAVERAKAFITEAIRTNPGLGHGCGPVNHHARRTIMKFPDLLIDRHPALRDPAAIRARRGRIGGKARDGVAAGMDRSASGRSGRQPAGFAGAICWESWMASWTFRSDRVNDDKSSNSFQAGKTAGCRRHVAPGGHQFLIRNSGPEAHAGTGWADGGLRCHASQREDVEAALARAGVAVQPRGSA